MIPEAVIMEISAKRFSLFSSSCPKYYIKVITKP